MLTNFGTYDFRFRRGRNLRVRTSLHSTACHSMVDPRAPSDFQELASCCTWRTWDRLRASPFPSTFSSPRNRLLSDSEDTSAFCQYVSARTFASLAVDRFVCRNRALLLNSAVELSRRKLLHWDAAVNSPQSKWQLDTRSPSAADNRDTIVFARAIL